MPPPPHPVHTFPLTPLTSYQTPGAAIKRPTALTHFSYDATHTFQPNSTQSLRYYYTPPLGVSLSEGYETFEEMDDGGDEHLEGLLKAVEEVERRKGERVVGGGEAGIRADVCTWRGMMTKVCLWRPGGAGWSGRSAVRMAWRG